MDNPFQIGEEADLSFGDEDFLLDSIDLEAIAAKALQTKPPTVRSNNLSKPNSVSRTQQQNSFQQINTATNNTQRQFQPFLRANNTSSSSSVSQFSSTTPNEKTLQPDTRIGNSNLSTPQNKSKKFVFKPKKSPENAITTRPATSPLQNPNISPVLGSSPNTFATNGRSGLQAQIPGVGTSQGLRTPASNQAVQPAMAVTVKRDGSSVTNIAQQRVDQKSPQGLTTDCESFRVSSLRQLNNLNPNNSTKLTSQTSNLSGISSAATGHQVSNPKQLNTLNSNSLPSQHNQRATTTTKVFQKYVPPADIITNTQTLRQPSSLQASSTNPKLRKPSMNSNMNPSNNLISGMNQNVSRSGTPPTQMTTLRSNTLTNPPNRSQQFVKYTDSQTINKTLPSTPHQTTQVQPMSVSPVQASTPGYRIPSGGPSPGSSRSYRGGTPIQQTGQAYPATPSPRGPNPVHHQRYPTTPRTGGATFSTTGSAPQFGSGVNRPNNNSQQQVPLLTPRVAQLCQTPSGNGSKNAMRTRARKFPGPAGVLPKLKPGQKLDNATIEDTQSAKKKKTSEPSLDESFTSSQDSTIDEFQRGAWLTMNAELGKSAQSILTSYNIAIVLRKASLKQLSRKQVPNLCVMIRSVTHSGSDACVLLKDPSGEMQGTLHKKIVEDYQADLKPGCVLVLRKVGVLSPSIRNHYLNITPSNLVQVYPAETSSTQCSQASPSRSHESQPRITRSHADEVAVPGPHNVDSNEQTSSKEINPDGGQDSGNLKNTNGKTLLIEGINTPVRSHSKRNLPTNPKGGQNLGDVTKGVKTPAKSLLIEGINTPVRSHRPQLKSLDSSSRSLGNATDVQQKNRHSDDSGINLDQSSGGSSINDEMVHHVETGKDESNNLSWLRKRQMEQDTNQAVINDESSCNVSLPAKRPCLEPRNSNRASLPDEKLTKRVESATSKVNSHGDVLADDDNFESLLEGIGDDFFDDF